MGEGDAVSAFLILQKKRMRLCYGTGFYIVAAPAMMLEAIEKYFMLREIGLDWDRKKDS